MLTKRQKQILDFIKAFINKNSYSPTYEEIAKRFKLSSVATVHQHIKTLSSMGYLNKIKNQPRSIEINKKNKPRKSGLVSIPLLGTIAAGSPIEAIEVPEKIKVAKSQLAKSGEHFALRVEGDSMVPMKAFLMAIQ